MPETVAVDYAMRGVLENLRKEKKDVTNQIFKGLESMEMYRNGRLHQIDEIINILTSGFIVYCPCLERRKKERRS